MNKVTVLVEGYARELSSGSWQASSTATLITTQDGELIIVDPGANLDRLKKKLKENEVDPAKVRYIFLTHCHPDHFLVLALFPNAELLDINMVYQDDGSQRPVSGAIPGTDIRIIPTPGHTLDHSSLVVPTEEGAVVISGDVFWWTQEESQTIDLNKTDEFAVDFNRLKESREKLLGIANWIIPGHGKMFRVNR